MPWRFVTGGASFAANSIVTATAYSSPTPLGTFTTASDGSVSGEFDKSHIVAGQHVIVLSGVSPSGETVSYYQFVTVGQTGSDIDADSVADADDTCIFIQSWYDEVSGKDLCKAQVKNTSKEIVPDLSIKAPTPPSADTLQFPGEAGAIVDMFMVPSVAVSDSSPLLSAETSRLYKVDTSRLKNNSIYMLFIIAISSISGVLFLVLGRVIYAKHAKQIKNY